MAQHVDKIGKLVIILILCCPIMLTSFLTLNDDDMIELLQEYTELNQQYSKAFTKKEYEKQRIIYKKIDSFHEGKLLPALSKIENAFCETKDKKLLIAYLNMLIATNHSASEATRCTLGKMFTCHPYAVQHTINTMNSVDKEQVIKDLSFGFENIIYNIDTTNIDIKHLRQRIKNLE